MASVAVGASYMGPLGGNQGQKPYPSGPSQCSILIYLGHTLLSEHIVLFYMILNVNVYPNPIMVS
jgi:hypothetical protein